MACLHIAHLPGATIADPFYRKIESMFPDNSYEERMRIIIPEIESTGLKYEELSAAVKRSLTLITDIEAFLRLIIKEKPCEFYVEMDALATSLRIARALFQMRKRGKELQTTVFKQVSERLLTKNGVESIEIENWRNSLDFFACDTRIWNWETVVSSAESMPVSFLVKLLDDETATNGIKALVPTVALHWVVQDLAELIHETPSKLGYIGPIRDMLTENKLSDTECNARINLSIRVLDMYAEQVYQMLNDKSIFLPVDVRNYITPIFEYTKIVFGVLQQEGYI